MKNFTKNIAVFIFLTLLVSFMVGCPNTEATKDIKDTTDNSAEKLKTRDYPPAPKAIATAEIELINGETFKLEDNKGKVILFNLWAVWCGPCIQEMPHLNEMQEKYKDQDLVIVGLNIGDDIGNKESLKNIEKFVERQKLNYTIGWADRPVAKEFFNLGQMGGVVPQSFLINRQGELTGIFQGGSPKVIALMKENVDKIVNEK